MKIHISNFHLFFSIKIKSLKLSMFYVNFLIKTHNVKKLLIKMEYKIKKVQKRLNQEFSYVVSLLLFQ